MLPPSWLSSTGSPRNRAVPSLRKEHFLLRELQEKAGVLEHATSLC